MAYPYMWYFLGPYFWTFNSPTHGPISGTYNNQEINIPKSGIYNIQESNLNLNPNYQEQNLNLNPNYQETNLNLNPNYQDTIFNLNPNYQEANLNLNPNYQETILNLNPNYQEANLNLSPNLNLNPNYQEKILNLNPNYHESNLNLNPNYLENILNLNPNYHEANLNFNPNYQKTNLNLNPNYQETILNLNPNYQEAKLNLNPKYHEANLNLSPNLNLNPNYQQTILNLNPNYQEANLNLNPNYQETNLNLNPNKNLNSNYQETILNLNPNYQETKLNLNPNYQEANLNLNPSYQATNLNLNPNYQEANLNLNPNYQATNLNLNPNYQETNLNLNPNYYSSETSDIIYPSYDSVKQKYVDNYILSSVQNMYTPQNHDRQNKNKNHEVDFFQVYNALKRYILDRNKVRKEPVKKSQMKNEHFEEGSVVKSSNTEVKEEFYSSPIIRPNTNEINLNKFKESAIFKRYKIELNISSESNEKIPLKMKAPSSIQKRILEIDDNDNNNNINENSINKNNSTSNQFDSSINNTLLDKHSPLFNQLIKAISKRNSTVEIIEPKLNIESQELTIISNNSKTNFITGNVSNSAIHDFNDDLDSDQKLDFDKNSLDNINNNNNNNNKSSNIYYISINNTNIVNNTDISPKNESNYISESLDNPAYLINAGNLSNSTTGDFNDDINSDLKLKFDKNSLDNIDKYINNNINKSSNIYHISTNNSNLVSNNEVSSKNESNFDSEFLDNPAYSINAENVSNSSMGDINGDLDSDLKLNFPKNSLDNSINNNNNTNISSDIYHVSTNNSNFVNNNEVSPKNQSNSELLDNPAYWINAGKLSNSSMSDFNDDLDSDLKLDFDKNSLDNYNNINNNNISSDIYYISPNNSNIVNNTDILPKNESNYDLEFLDDEDKNSNIYNVVIATNGIFSMSVPESRNIKHDRSRNLVRLFEPFNKTNLTRFKRSLNSIKNEIRFDKRRKFITDTFRHDLFHPTSSVSGSKYGRGCNIKCPKEISPVCGSDGIIYSSLCDLKNKNCGQGVTDDKEKCQRSSGSKCEHSCSEIRDPVCGSDGRTYINKCILKVEQCRSGTVFSHNGECFPKDLSDDCPKDCPKDNPKSSPVCGSDGNTYANECEMKSRTCGQKVVVTSKNHCKTTKNCGESCFFSYKPVCASDGRIYSSKCQMQVKNCGRHIFQTPMVHCRPQERTTRGCPITCEGEKLAPVCSSNGNIYDNECDMRRLNCGTGGALTIYKVSIDKCFKRFQTCESIRCPSSLDPVCGTDGVTYINYCLLHKASCKKGVNRAHYGVCPDLNRVENCSAPCKEEHDYYPVCGSDGNVYESLCDMTKRTCGQKVVPVALHHCQATEHCLTNCVQTSKEAVCASDGKMYRNDCEMKTRNCGRHVYQVPLSNCLSAFNFFRCMRICPSVFDPVCGTDGKTYSNECFLQMEKCHSRSVGRSLVVTSNHFGKCGDPVPKAKLYMFR